jgi:hypothetical protein
VSALSALLVTGIAFEPSYELEEGGQNDLVSDFALGPDRAAE